MSRRWWVSVGWVTVGTMVANVCAYLVHLPAGRWLGPDGYGEFAVLLAAMLVLAVPALALQAVIAREIVRGGAVAEMWNRTWRLTVVVALAIIPGTPLMMYLADTSAATTIAGLAAAPGLVLLSGAQGVLQGARRFTVLAVVLAVVGVLRWAPVVGILGLGAGPPAALCAGAAGTFAGAGLAWFVVGRAAIGEASDVSRTGRASSGVTDVMRASQVQFVLMLAVTMDLLLSRSVLSETDAGVYALGAVATKAAFWLPAAIGVVIYPWLADPTTSGRSLGRALTVVAAIGAVVTAAAGVVGPLVPVIVSESYRPLTSILWVFAATGALLAILQVALLWAIAAERTAVALIAWVVVAVEAALILAWAHSVVSLVTIAATSAAISTLATVVVATSIGPRSATQPRPQTPSASRAE